MKKQHSLTDHSNAVWYEILSINLNVLTYCTFFSSTIISTLSKRICCFRIIQIRAYFRLSAFALFPETEVGGRKTAGKTERKISNKDITTLIILQYNYVIKSIWCAAHMWREINNDSTYAYLTPRILQSFLPLPWQTSIYFY